jgi:alkylated DNA repair dioxygenase AlkB
VTDAPSVAKAPDLALEHDPAWVDEATADAWLAALREEVDWRQESIVLFGRRVAMPRLTAWHGDPGCAYTYSGLRNEPRPWTPTLRVIRARVEATLGQRFNAVLLNRYRDGTDGMGWHADDEPELGPDPTVASVSLGATRTFQLKHRTRRDASRVELELGHGALLVMRPPTQACWLHQVPKRRGRDGPGERVNLTFRHVTPSAPRLP